MRILLTAGHSQKDQGAIAFNGIETEFQYWRRVFRLVTRYFDYLDRDECVVDFGARDLGETIWDFYDLIDKYDVIIEGHFNAFNGYVGGSEVLVPKHNELARTVGEEFLLQCRRYGQRKVRQVKEIDITEQSRIRGAPNLRYMQQKCRIPLLIEPFFGDNGVDYMEPESSVQLIKRFVDSLLENLKIND